MALTAYLKSTKPASEQDAQKVATYNALADDYDASLGGQLNLSVAGSANVALTRVQALNAVLKFTGVLTGSITIYIPVITNLALTPPTTTIGTPRIFTVWNATTGAFPLTVKTSAVGSLGVVVTQGEKVNLFHDETNVYVTQTGPGTGTVVGPVASTDSELPLFSGTAGQVLKRSNTLTGIPKLTSGVVSIGVAGTDYVSPSAGTTFTAKQVFTPSASTAMLNIGTAAANPSTPTEGDIYRNSATNKAYLFSGGAWREIYLAGISVIIGEQVNHAVNAQTGTTYTFATADKGKLVTFSNAAAIAVTLPQATSGFSSFYCDAQNRGAGTATITPTTSTIDGAASLALATNQGVRVFSDGANYFTQRGM